MSKIKYYELADLCFKTGSKFGTDSKEYEKALRKYTKFTKTYKPYSKYKDFTDDKEKMKDFKLLTKAEFLSSYSYLTEGEYNLTKQKEVTDE